METTKLLSIYISESAKYKLRPFYEAVIYAAKRSNLSEAMVLRGIMSYKSGHIHTSSLFALAEDLPIKIEIIDSDENINTFTKIVKKMFQKAHIEGIITLQEIQIEKF